MQLRGAPLFGIRYSVFGIRYSVFGIRYSVYSGELRCWASTLCHHGMRVSGKDAIEGSLATFPGLHPIGAPSTTPWQARGDLGAARRTYNGVHAAVADLRSAAP